MERRRERYLIIYTWQQIENVKENILKMETGSHGNPEEGTLRRLCIKISNDLQLENHPQNVTFKITTTPQPLNLDQNLRISSSKVERIIIKQSHLCSWQAAPVIHTLMVPSPPPQSRWLPSPKAIVWKNVKNCKHGHFEICFNMKQYILHLRRAADCLHQNQKN